MTAPLPSSYLSPYAGVFNALVRHVNRLLRARIGELNTQLVDAVHRNQELGGGQHTDRGSVDG